MLRIILNPYMELAIILRFKADSTETAKNKNLIYQQDKITLSLYQSFNG